ncbi:HNH endonuclease [Nonlabens sp.]|jgi:5-methylcytosine-specific restriction protein A|uniref:HNH endonuclease n=1 Tax=Nonlabens sp. TaxID=1888209 RepID=UPI0039E5704C
MEKKVIRPWIQPRVKHERSVDNSKFYNSRTWRKHRSRFLEKFPMCLHCERNGITTPANIVDHIHSISQGGDKLNDTNLQPLCKKCHEKKSAKESAQVRGMGKKVTTVKACTSLDSENFTRNK